MEDTSTKCLRKVHEPRSVQHWQVLPEDVDDMAYVTLAQVVLLIAYNLSSLPHEHTLHDETRFHQGFPTYLEYLKSPSEPTIIAKIDNLLGFVSYAHCVEGNSDIPRSEISIAKRPLNLRRLTQIQTNSCYSPSTKIKEPADIAIVHSFLNFTHDKRGRDSSRD
ncbi:hypothetical protein BDV95DRAFT_16190 [Massariosphaeria phaeospora]|uniref:Uncharacterized protein n=1 Tax=Massariosphaeria phaeospora TaxID=100035 RepID=A0A7C8IFC8_9PLEO|nr:hypothetical protein BDV95DRAFT_16190 [Massariosphaeria phaeospora]